jgi:hypothetical protein
MLIVVIASVLFLAVGLTWIIATLGEDFEVIDRD